MLLVGEIGLNAALAGHFGVPVALVTGDQQAVAEAQELLGADLTTVAVKQSVARYAARSVAPSVAQDRIREAMAQALRLRRQPWRVPGPITLSVDFMKTEQADMAAILPGGERTAPRTVEFTHDEYLTVFRAWRVLFTLGQLD